MKKAIKLNGSDTPMYFPNGDREEAVLERMLYYAVEQKMDRGRLVIVLHHERVANFNIENPRYTNVEHKVKLKELFDLYEQINGREYRQSTLEEMEREARRQNARIIFR